jgi:hypothetical protein
MLSVFAAESTARRRWAHDGLGMVDDRPGLGRWDLGAGATAAERML